MKWKKAPVKRTETQNTVQRGRVQREHREPRWTEVTPPPSLAGKRRRRDSAGEKGERRGESMGSVRHERGGGWSEKQR